jgi:PAS domain S-box-containing protein
MAHKHKDHIQSFITALPQNAARIIQDLPGIFLNPASDASDADNLLRSVLDSATEYAIIAADLDRNIITWNSGAERIFGYTRGEIIGKKKLSFLIPEEENKSSNAREFIQEQIKARGIWKGETLRKRKDGGTFYARIIVTPFRSRNRHIIGTIAVIRDITNEKRLYQELENAKALNEIIIDNIPSGIVVLGMDQKIVIANEAFQRMTGNENRTVKGQTLCSAMNCWEGSKDPGGAKGSCADCAFLAELGKQAANRTGPQDLEQKMTFRSGHRKTTRHLLIKIIRLKLGRENYLLAVFNDFTERKLLTDKLEDYMDHLKQKVDERTAEVEKTGRILVQELEVANLIQKSLLKNNVREIPRYKYFYKFYPSRSIGGDFFNINKITDNHYYFYISDVSGHGVPAAMLTVFFQQSLRNIVAVTTEPSPGAILTQVNRSFYRENFPGSPFITVFFCVLDLPLNMLTYAVAGHHNCIMYNSVSGTVNNFGYYSRPVGTVENSVYRDETLKLEKDDNILLYTDGITEIFDRNGRKVFDSGLLLKFISERARNSDANIIKSLISHLKDLRKLPHFDDDVAVLNIRRQE